MFHRVLRRCIDYSLVKLISRTTIIYLFDSLFLSPKAAVYIFRIKTLKEMWKDEKQQSGTELPRCLVYSQP